MLASAEFMRVAGLNIY